MRSPMQSVRATTYQDRSVSIMTITAAACTWVPVTAELQLYGPRPSSVAWPWHADSLRSLGFLGNDDNEASLRLCNVWWPFHQRKLRTIRGCKMESEVNGWVSLTQMYYDVGIARLWTFGAGHGSFCMKIMLHNDTKSVVTSLISLDKPHVPIFEH